jgi:hypothetical protein
MLARNCARRVTTNTSPLLFINDIVARMHTIVDTNEHDRVMTELTKTGDAAATSTLCASRGKVTPTTSSPAMCATWLRSQAVCDIARESYATAHTAALDAADLDAGDWRGPALAGYAAMYLQRRREAIALFQRALATNTKGDNDSEKRCLRLFSMRYKRWYSPPSIGDLTSALQQREADTGGG